MNVADLIGQIGVGEMALRLAAAAPLVVVRSRRFERPAGHRDVDAVGVELLKFVNDKLVRPISGSTSSNADSQDRGLTRRAPGLDKDPMAY